MIHPSFELFQHTADIGIRVVAPLHEALIEPAASGLYAVIGELKPVSSNVPGELIFDERGDCDSILLRNYLSELLFQFEKHRRIVMTTTVHEFSADHLSLTAATQVVDEDKSIYHHEVKAVTYHELTINEIPGGFEARIIVDI